MRDHLIARAKASLAGNRRPRVVNLRRAVSDSYYAVFHALATHMADRLVGRNRRGTDAWRRIYRGLDHGKAKQEFERKDFRSIDPRLNRIAIAFIQLQEARHEADYDPVSPLARRSDVQPLISMAEAAFIDLDSLSSDLSYDLSAILLVKKRQ